MEFVDGNHFDKYRSTNPIHRHLVQNFLRAIGGLYESANPNTLLEVGCGPGDLAGELRKRTRHWSAYQGIDLSGRQIEMARKRYPELRFEQADVYELPYDDHSFDLVLACEVMEHLERPEEAIKEIARVAKNWVLVSVPWEPSWRILNCLRGRYLRDWGNTPGHVCHFNRRQISKLVETVGCIEKVATPFPWTALLVRVSTDMACGQQKVVA